MSALSWRIAADGWTIVAGPLPSPTISAADFLPQGAYTTARTIERVGVLLLDAHWNRLDETVQLLGHDYQLARTPLESLLCELLQARGATAPTAQETRIRITVDCTQHPGEVWFSLEPLTVPDAAAYAQGVGALTRPMQRTNPRAKNSAFIAATQGARALLGSHHKGVPINEVLMVGSDGAILEGLSSNFFAVRGGVLHTAEEGVLPGSTRTMVLEEAEAAGCPLRLQPIMLTELAELEEAFISSTTRMVLPLVQIDDVPIGPGSPGSLTRHLAARVQARLREEVVWVCQREASWHTGNPP